MQDGIVPEVSSLADVQSNSECLTLELFFSSVVTHKCDHNSNLDSDW